MQPPTLQLDRAPNLRPARETAEPSFLTRTRSAVRDRLRGASGPEADLPTLGTKLTVGAFLEGVVDRGRPGHGAATDVRLVSVRGRAPPGSGPRRPRPRLALARRRAGVPERQVGVRLVTPDRGVPAGRAARSLGPCRADRSRHPQCRPPGPTASYPAPPGLSALGRAGPNVPRRDRRRPARGSLPRRSWRRPPARRDPRAALVRRRPHRR